MSNAIRSWIVATGCPLVLVGCLFDLKPDVGELVDPLRDAGAASSTLDAAVVSDTASPVDEAEAGAQGDAATVVASDASMTMGPGPTTGCNIKDSNPDQEVSFKKDVWPILTGCRCHSSKSEDPRGILEVGLTIDDFDTLRMGGDRTGTKIIVAGNACESIILQKLSENPPFGVRMPLDGPYLSSDVRQMISDWITEGARDN